MALNIRPSSASSSSASTSQSSGTKNSSPELFALNLATAAKTAQKSATTPKASPSRHATAAPKPAAKAASTAKPKPVEHHSDDSQSRSAAARSNGTSSKPKATQSAEAAANAQSGQDGSAPDDAAAAAEANADNNSATNGTKGRTSAPRAPAKTNAAQSAAAAKASDAADDPTSADSTNQSGLSLIQLLAKSLESDDAEVSSTDASAPAATDKTNADGADATSDDPNAIALAMFSQALAAALPGQQTPGNVASAQTDGATAAIDSATHSQGAASIQDMMTVLARDVAADAKGKSDDGAAQFNVDPTKTDVTNASAVDSTAAAPGALAHLGIASHLAAQHLRNDTSTADLRSPVGSPAWEDEIGTHLTWMTQKGLETGSLRVSPEHLGPVEVNISIQNGDASVWFAANHPDTRTALEQALPRLREMFAHQGMNLADSGVSRQNLSQQGSRDRARSQASQAVSGVAAIGGSDAGSGSAARLNLGLVDLYA